MDMTQASCREFLDRLASSDPTPGGGGAAAMLGAAGAALGQMVCSLTIGKKKYASVEAEICEIREELETLRQRLLALVEEDARAFAPLAAAYSIPKEDPDRAQRLEEATLVAVRPPMDIMTCCCRVMELVEILAEKGSRLAVSDAGCAAAFCRAALESASLNVFINTKSLLDRKTADALNGQAQTMLDTFCPRGDAVFGAVRKSFG